MAQDKFVVKSNEEVGRFAVASEPLRPGKIIFEEFPFAWGPKSDSPPLCLGCCSPVDCSVLCTKCNWPVCGPNCEKLPVHAEAECKIFSGTKCRFQPVEDLTETCLQYECITPLRVLLAKERQKERWSQEIELMESHCEIRKQNEIWQFNQINIVEYIRKACKLDKRFSEDLIHKVCGILEVNAFEARAPSGYLIRCLYPKLAILSHNCISNIRHSINCLGDGQFNDYKVTVRAAINLNVGDEIFSSYTYSLWPTLVRREFLRESKYFECKCQRCSDKTELGTHLGTLKCGKCDNGVIISTDALSSDCEWKCTHCPFSTNAQLIRRVYARIQLEIDEIEMVSGAEGIERREAIFRKYRSVFHPNNAYMQILRTALTQLYGRAEGYTIHELPDLLQERKVELCNQLLSVLNVIEPGYSRIRGITLYEIHAPLMMLARAHFTNGLIDKFEFRRRMEEAVKYLEESVEILMGEPENSLEGELGVVAKEALEGLKQNFEMLIDTA